MAKEVTNEDLAKSIDDLAQITAKGFDGTATKQDMAAVKQDVSALKQDMAEVKGKMTAVESKLDRILYKELDRHEHWIRQLADKIGVELPR